MTSSRLPVLILHTGDPEPVIRSHHGGYGEQLRRVAGLTPDEARIVAVYQGETPQAPECYRAALITGSPAMVTDHEPWSESTAAWLRHAVAAGLPVFGVCYGHQLLAYALGGEVNYNPTGSGLGTHTVRRVRPEGQTRGVHEAQEGIYGAQGVQGVQYTSGDPLTEGLPDEFPAQLLHAQVVTRPPVGAVVLAKAAHDPYQLLRYAPGVYSSQFHPEFDTDFMREHLLHHADHYGKKGYDALALAENLAPTPLASSLVKRFLALYAATQ